MPATYSISADAPGTYVLEDDGILGNNMSQVRYPDGSVTVFEHPADELIFVSYRPGVDLIVDLGDSLGTATFKAGETGYVRLNSVEIRNLNTGGRSILDAASMTGGAGDDWYVVRDATDVITEKAGGADDRVWAYVTWSLVLSDAISPQQIEVISTFNPTLAVTAINLTGNSLQQTIYGNAARNELSSGGGGGDSLVGLGGDDVYLVYDPSDRVYEDPDGGTDQVLADTNWRLSPGSHVEFMQLREGTATSLTGNELPQNIAAWTGEFPVNNVLDGGGGGDVMIGYAGNDIYFVRDTSDLVYERAGEGNDSVFTFVDWTLATAQYVEILSIYDPASTNSINLGGNEFDQTVSGNAGANTLSGFAGNDVIDGLAGSDTMIGGAGNDRFVVREALDLVIEAQGEGDRDRVFAYADWVLNADSDVEVLETFNHTYTLPINLSGNGLAQSIQGNEGNNILDGGGGADVLIGRGGDDWYVVRSGADRVYDEAGSGTDQVFAYVSWTLNAGSQVELVQTVNSASTFAIDLTGNEFGQWVFGNDGTNFLDGKDGGDVLQGYGGSDNFAFTSTLSGSNIDTIVDFVSGLDRILIDDAIFTGLSLGALGAGAFVTGSSAQDADDRIIYDPATGSLYFDADGNSAGAQVKFAILQSVPTIAPSDFLVI